MNADMSALQDSCRLIKDISTPPLTYMQHKLAQHKDINDLTAI